MRPQTFKNLDTINCFLRKIWSVLKTAHLSYGHCSKIAVTNCIGIYMKKYMWTNIDSGRNICNAVWHCTFLSVADSIRVHFYDNGVLSKTEVGRLCPLNISNMTV